MASNATPPGISYTLDDRDGEWLSDAEPAQAGQVIWGSARQRGEVRHGSPIAVSVALVFGKGPDQGGDTLRLRVADAEPGIADADRERLFDRYAREMLPGAERTGLGLHVSRELTAPTAATWC